MSNNIEQEGTLLKRAKAQNKLTTMAYKTKLSHSWLNKIADGLILNPSVNKIQKVIEQDTGKKLC